MTWFKVDDTLTDHPKMIRLQGKDGWHSAVALWTMAGVWCSKHLTDGHLPAAMVQRLGCSRVDAEQLVSVGLWERADEGYQFHDWTAMNPTRQEVEERRAKTRQRVAEWRRNSVTDDVTDAVRNDVSNASPVPTRPDPSDPRSQIHPPPLPRQRRAQLARSEGGPRGETGERARRACRANDVPRGEAPRVASQQAAAPSARAS